MDEPAASTDGCYWDVTSCRWVRWAPAVAVPLPRAEDEAVPLPVAT